MNNITNNDVITILRARKRLTKTWKADGSIKAYDNEVFFKVEDVTVSGIAELSQRLASLEAMPDRCIIRGRFTGEDKEHTRRRKACFEDQPLHALMLDVENFKSGADPITEPEAAIDEYITKRLPEPFHQAAYHWQLSSSAGHPSKPGLRAHVWFWLSEPRTSAELRAWAKATGLAADHAVFDEIQPHYTASPQFEPGVDDPVPRRSGFVRGVVEQVTLDALPVAATHGPTHGNVWSTDQPLGLSIEECRGYLRRIDPSGERSEWLRVLSGLHYETSGSAEGLRLADEWSSGALAGVDVPNYAGLEDVERCWNSFGAQHPAPVTGRTIVAKAREAATEGVALARNERGRIPATRNNLYEALRRPELCGWQIGYDTFREDIRLAPKGTHDQWCALQDTHYTDIALRLERAGFTTINTNTLRECVAYQAEGNTFDSALLWLDGLQWDGVARVDTFCSTYLGAADTPYTRAVGAYMWTALAGRALSPGVKVDMTLILVGAQGVGKSTAVQALVPSAEHYQEVSLAARDADTARLLRGCQVGEIAELRGLRTRDCESIKAFLTRTHESWIPKYCERSKTFARRCVFIGTTNDDAFLSDPTGERRFLPLEVGRCDVEAIKRDREQLWAEAAVKFRENGIEWRESQELAKAEHQRFKAVDPWLEPVERWLELPAAAGGRNGDGDVSMADVMQAPLGLLPRDCHSGNARRVAAVLRELGLEERRVGRRRQRVWRRKQRVCRGAVGWKIGTTEGAAEGLTRGLGPRPEWLPEAANDGGGGRFAAGL